MLRSHFEFAYVLNFIIFISFVSSASFGDFCSNDLSCHYPLICSNSSNKCICPLSSSVTFWNVEQNSCLFCPYGWIEWQNETCLLFIQPPDGGIAREKAKNACLTYSGQLLQIDYYQDYIEFQYKINTLLQGEHVNELNEFLSNGIWINFTDYTNWMNSYEWCDMEYENDTWLWNDCIRITKQFSNNKMNTSLCLSHVQCNEKLSYICEKLAIIQNDITNDNRLFGLIGGLVGNLFGSKPQPPPPPPPPPEPIIIYHTNPPKTEIEQPLPQTSKSNNTILYISIAAVVVLILIIILCCCFCGGFLLLKSDNSSTTTPRPSRFHRRHDRTSVDSTASDATY
ncbi:unnamed protein product [Rotaria sp. Silwood1]|nr:unnamed protein product [Rotaria sp. Silwood1]CAF1567893.1 unnamed protein product [Rotaria sp. Silwood1]CAF3736308.1 unnamed protein product [Rotaria sp. Silwood1]CAF4880462.1 unnamed protein product [Rotaria sp. Silwood1]